MHMQERELYFGKTFAGVSPMTTVVTIRKSGNANIVSLPKALLEQLGVAAGDCLEARLQDGHIVLQPKRQRMTLEELLEGITPETYNTEEDREWMNMRPVGEELL